MNKSLPVVDGGIKFQVRNVPQGDVACWVWAASTRLSDGSTAEIFFDAAARYGIDENTMYYPAIEVYRKRKHRNLFSGKYTGRVGLEAAGFFLQALRIFEENITKPGDSIVVQGYDGKRHRAYHKVLAKRGYHATVDDGLPAIVKKF